MSVTAAYQYGTINVFIRLNSDTALHKHIINVNGRSMAHRLYTAIFDEPRRSSFAYQASFVALGSERVAFVHIIITKQCLNVCKSSNVTLDARKPTFLHSSNLQRGCKTLVQLAHELEAQRCTANYSVYGRARPRYSPATKNFSVILAQSFIKFVKITSRGPAGRMDPPNTKIQWSAIQCKCIGGFYKNFTGVRINIIKRPQHIPILFSRMEAY